MSTRLEYNVDDRLTPIRLELIERDGTAKDVSGWTFTFSMWDATDDSVKVNAQSCSFETDGTDGIVVYNWASGDLDTAGTYWAYFKGTSGGLSAQYPQEQHGLKVVVSSVP